MEIITGFLTSQAIDYVGGAVAVFILAWIFKQIPNEKIKIFVGKIMYGAGVTATLGLSKWPVTAKFWNKIIEPWMVDLIDNIAGHGIQEFIKGLRSDNNN